MPPFSFARQLRLCQKELRETLRDRRTLVTLLLMPLLVYPLLSMTLHRFLAAGIASPDLEYRIAVGSDTEELALRSALTEGASVVEANGVRAEPPEARVRFRVGQITDKPALAALEDGDIDALVRLRGRDPVEVELTRLGGDAVGREAAARLVERLEALNHRVLVRRLERAGLNPRPAFAVSATEVGERDEPPPLATIVPLVLVLMTITGAVYPAIDLTAGERERGTMEAVMASPAPRVQLLVGKYVAVVAVALLTAVANLGAMLVTLAAGGYLELVVGDAGLSAKTVLQVLGLLVLLSGFFAAVLLALTSFARSFKEAQAYLIPVMLLALAPGVLSLMPGVPLAGVLAVTPLVSIVLLARDLFTGSADPVAAVAAVLSTAAYAIAGIGVAARLFGSDALLNGSETSLGSALQRPRRAVAVPSFSQAAMTLALLFPMYFVLSTSLRQWSDEMSGVLMASAVGTALLFGGVPVASAVFCRNRLRTTFRFARFSPPALVAAALLAGGLWAAAHELFVLAQRAGFAGVGEEHFRRVETMLAEWRNLSPALILLCLAVVPAVFEELTFRGYFFSALLSTGSAARATVVSAVVFGLFHVAVGNVLAVERFLPTALIGLALGWLAWRTGSVWPGMLLHALHNGLLLMAAYYQEALVARGIGVEESEHLPPAWLATAAGLLAAGVAILWFATRRHQPH